MLSIFRIKFTMCRCDGLNETHRNFLCQLCVQLSSSSSFYFGMFFCMLTGWKLDFYPSGFSYLAFFIFIFLEIKHVQ